MARKKPSLWLAMGGACARARRYLPAALTGGFAAIAGLDLEYWVGAFRTAPLAQDTSVYYVAAQIGLARGWNRIYDLTLQAQFFARLHAGVADPSFFLYTNPPLLAWLIVPLTLVPPVGAYLAIVTLCLGALTATAALAAPRDGWSRILFVLGALAWYPVVYSLRLGQLPLLIGAAVVLSWWLDQHGWPKLGGAVLAMTMIKPQLALLVAPCLLLAGRRGLFVTWLGSTLALGLLSILSLGASGVGQYFKLLAIIRTVPFDQQFTLAALGGGSAVTTALQALAVILTLVAAYRIRHRGTAPVVAVALLGSVLAAPHLHVDDFAVLVPVAWLLLRDAHSAVQRLGLLPMAVTMELAWVLGPLPILASLTISLLLFLVPRREQRSMALAA